MGANSSLNGCDKDIFTQPLLKKFYCSNLNSNDLTWNRNGFHEPDTQWSCIDYSHSHGLIAVGSFSGFVLVIGKDAVHRFRVDRGQAIVFLRFLRKELCVATSQGRLIFWDLVEKEMLYAAEPLNLVEISSICVIPESNSRFIVLGQTNGKVRFYDSLVRKRCFLAPLPVLTENDAPSVVCAEICPTQCHKLLIAYSTDTVIYLYNYVLRKMHSTSKHVQSKYSLPSICSSLALSREHPIFIAGCENGTICIFKFENLSPLKTVLLDNHPKLTPIHKIVIKERKCPKKASRLTLYVSGGRSPNVKTVGVAKLDISINNKGLVEGKLGLTVNPISGRASSFCVGSKIDIENGNQPCSEVMIQNVEGEVQVLTVQSLMPKSDEDDGKSSKITHCYLFHSELKDVVDMSFSSGACEELSIYNSFEPQTPIDFLGGGQVSRDECDYLATGHCNGLCVLWKVTRREFFIKILEIKAASLYAESGIEVKEDLDITAINLFRNIITVGMGCGDVFEITLDGLHKEHRKIKWQSIIRPKRQNHGVEFIRRSEKGLVVVDQVSLTTVSAPDGETLSVFTPFASSEPDHKTRITVVSIQPSLLIKESVIYFGFSNGLWCLYGFAGSKICLGPLDDWKFNSAITYIARLSPTGEFLENKLAAEDEQTTWEVGGQTVSLQDTSREVMAVLGGVTAGRVDQIEIPPDGDGATVRNTAHEKKTEEEKLSTVHRIVSKDDFGVVPAQEHLISPRRRVRGGSCGSVLPNPRKSPRKNGTNTSKNRSPEKNKLYKKRNTTACSMNLLPGQDVSSVKEFKSKDTDHSVPIIKMPDDSADDAENKQDSPSVRAIPESSVSSECASSLETQTPQTGMVNEDEELLSEETNDGYLVICSRNRVVVIQVDLPNFHICSRYSFKSQLLAAQVIHKASGKEGLVTVSENGRCTMLRLMDLHVLESRDLKMPLLINMTILPGGRYVAVSKRLEFWHGHFFEKPVNLSFFPHSEEEREEIKDVPKLASRREGSGFFGLFRKAEAVDCWNEAYKTLISGAPLKEAPLVGHPRHRYNLSHDQINLKRSKSAKIIHRPSKSTFSGNEGFNVNTGPHPFSSKSKSARSPVGCREIDESLKKMNERSDKIRHIAHKSSELNDSAQRFADLAKQLRKKNQGSWW